jgi:hypothetical protein
VLLIALLAFCTAARLVGDEPSESSCPTPDRAPAGIFGDFYSQGEQIRYRYCQLVTAAPGEHRFRMFEQLAQYVFTGDGFRPLLRTLVPGAGFAGGVTYAHTAYWDSGTTIQWNADLLGSANGSWQVIGSAAARLGHFPVRFEFDAADSELAALTYYGLGPNSAEADQSIFSLSLRRVSAYARWSPIPSLLIAGTVGGLWASQGPGRGSGAPSIEQIFTPANTPGLDTDTSYVTYGASVMWQYPAGSALHSYATSVAADIGVFSDFSGSRYSFRRFRLEWKQGIPVTSRDTVTTIVYLVDEKSDSGNAIPFYLQPTLGGNDIDNREGLQSYANYRFRAPLAVSFHLEATHLLWSIVGIFGFFDLGQVADSWSQLTSEAQRHSFGAGITLGVGGAPYLRFYYSWGGSEGSRQAVTGNSLYLGPHAGLALRTLF